jgi:hypothetical protein
MHLPSLSFLHEQFRVTALCDVSATVVEEVGNTWGVRKRFLHYQALIEQDDVDVVLVSNPNPYHSAVTLAAIAAGKHVLVENRNVREAHTPKTSPADFRKGLELFRDMIALMQDQHPGEGR